MRHWRKGYREKYEIKNGYEPDGVRVFTGKGKVTNRKTLLSCQMRKIGTHTARQLREK